MERQAGYVHEQSGLRPAADRRTSPGSSRPEQTHHWSLEGPWIPPWRLDDLASMAWHDVGRLGAGWRSAANKA